MGLFDGFFKTLDDFLGNDQEEEKDIKSQENVELAKESLVPILEASEVDVFEEAFPLERDRSNRFYNASLVEPFKESIPLVKDNTSVEKMRLSGNNLLIDLLSDIKKATREVDGVSSFDKGKFEASVKQRFIKTVQQVMTGMGSDIKEEHTEVDNIDYKNLNNKIDEAAEALSKEVASGLESSIEKSINKKYMFPIVGRVITAVGYMCHSLAKSVGLASPTAAELFQEAAKTAEEMQEKLGVYQTTRNEKNEREGYSYSLAALKEKGMMSEENLEQVVKLHDDMVAIKEYDYVVNQVGGNAAREALISGAKYDPYKNQALDDVREKFEILYNSLKEDKKKLQENNVYLAMAELEKSLFPASIVIGNKVYEGKINEIRVKDNIQNLDKAIKNSGSIDAKEAFNEFKSEVNKVNFKKLLETNKSPLVR